MFISENKATIKENVRLNYYIEKGLKIIGCNEEIEISKRVNNEFETKKMKLYQTITIQDFRRMFITHAVNSNIPPSVIMAMSTHANFNTLNKYYQKNTKELKKAMDTIKHFD